MCHAAPHDTLFTFASYHMTSLLLPNQLLVKGVNETLVAQRVVPALITLSSDPEM